ncbi:MAG TPA: KEOPS complex subunit Pcc1 [Methanotrichaceae archaeon]|nr:KEOPS complex subunit Pcc1 [Methanotrichaceae archaeon]
MIKARLVFRGKNAREVARSLEPDNLPNMRLAIEENCFCLELSAEKIGTMLSTADDILMNIKVAKETLVSAEER